MLGGFPGRVDGEVGCTEQDFQWGTRCGCSAESYCTVRAFAPKPWNFGKKIVPSEYCTISWLRKVEFEKS